MENMIKLRWFLHGDILDMHIHHNNQIDTYSMKFDYAENLANEILKNLAKIRTERNLQMKIECDLDLNELNYIYDIAHRANIFNYTIKKIYKTDEGLHIEFNNIILSEDVKHE